MRRSNNGLVGTQPVTAREIPGDLDIFFEDENGNSQFSFNGDNTNGLSVLNGVKGLWVEPGAEVKISGYLKNKGGTNAGGPLSDPNVDNCDNPGSPDFGGSLSNNGTAVRVYLQIDDPFNDTWIDMCIQDADAPLVYTGREWMFTINISDTPEGDYQYSIWAEGQNSGTRVTPIYSDTITVTSDANGVAFQEPTGESNDPDNDGTIPGDLPSMDNLLYYPALTGYFNNNTSFEIELENTNPEGSGQLFINYGLWVDGTLYEDSDGEPVQTGYAGPAPGERESVSFDIPTSAISDASQFSARLLDIAAYSETDESYYGRQDLPGTYNLPETIWPSLGAEIISCSVDTEMPITPGDEYDVTYEIDNSEPDPYTHTVRVVDGFGNVLTWDELTVSGFGTDSNTLTFETDEDQTEITTDMITDIRFKRFA